MNRISKIEKVVVWYENTVMTRRRIGNLRISQWISDALFKLLLRQLKGPRESQTL